MTHKYGQELPKEVENRIDAYIERIKNIKWFKLSQDYSEEKATKQINFALECFGIKASIEYRSLKTEKDWCDARCSVRDTALSSDWNFVMICACNAIQDAVVSNGREVARSYAHEAARKIALAYAHEAARDAALGGSEVQSQDLKEFSDKYPNGAFLQLIPLWEMGLFPVGVVDRKFICYVPSTN